MNCGQIWRKKAAKSGKEFFVRADVIFKMTL